MPADIVQTYCAFAYNNAWANHRLLTACAALDQAEFERARTGFFPSLQATLNHIYVIDLFYVDALEGGWLGPKAWANPIPYPTVEDLAPTQASIDKRLIAVCEALTPARLNDIVKVNRDTQVQTERRDRPLMHFFQHDIHHRGRTPCSPAPTSSRRNSTSFLRPGKRRFGPMSSDSSDGPRQRSGTIDPPIPADMY
jgi:uncharacterized damage-inducible protein DinB